MPENSRTRKRSMRRNISNEASDSEMFNECELHQETVQNETSPDKSSSKKVIRRTLTASFLASFFVGLLQTGHLYCILSGVLTQTELFRELVNVRYPHAKEKRIPLFRTLQWSWFFVAMFYIYGETCHTFCSEHRQLLHLTKITQFIGYISFVSYCTVFVATVLTFRKGLIKYQLSQLMWTIVTIGLVVGQCKFFAKNILNGIFWFFFPLATISMNDVAAYFCGIKFGKKFITAPFISISPNKTWEGFLGAAVCTLIFSFFFPVLLSHWSWYTCPAEQLYLTPLPPPLVCEQNPVFLPTVYSFPTWFGWGDISMTLLPIQFHGLVYGLFASLVAPFGGFLASAIKRAYNLKDFDSFMPGHGGMMDRMDCQLLMVCFTYVHYNTFIMPRSTSVRSVLASIWLLPTEDQISLFYQLREQLQGQNITII